MHWVIIKCYKINAMHIIFYFSLYSMRRVISRNVYTAQVTSSYLCNFYSYAQHHSQAVPKCKHQMRSMHSAIRQLSDVTSPKAMRGACGSKNRDGSCARRKCDTYLNSSSGHFVRKFQGRTSFSDKMR